MKESTSAAIASAQVAAAPHTGAGAGNGCCSQRKFWEFTPLALQTSVSTGLAVSLLNLGISQHLSSSLK